ncbi:uncharacterized protein LOC128953803 [Oppia nitens]|uniref:uncharacterized protein LOC128953803 n=1 Tax=Oppia nitens TaxID=1686743 RepID=UPI0023DB711E|nr:uncharacterized protein LOC128953803 [Oppia nitens]
MPVQSESDLTLCQKPLSCTKSSLDKLDNIFAKLVIIGDSDRKFPKKIEDLPMFCNASLEMIKIVDQYNQRCNKQLNKQVMSLSVHTARTQMANVCKSGKKQDQLMAAFPCATKSNKSVNKCMTRLIDAMIGAQNLQNDKLKIYMIIIALSHAPPGAMTRQKVLNLLCGDYEEDSDKCRTMKTPKRLKSQKRTKSFFLPLTQLLDSFQN